MTPGATRLIFETASTNQRRHSNDMLRIIACLLCACALATNSWAESGYDATYTLTLGPITVGEMQRRYRIDESGNYRFESDIRATGLASFMRSDELREVSSGTFRDDRFLPEHYTYERKNKRKPRSIATTFNPNAGTSETIYNGKTLTSDHGKPVLDKLVYQAQIMHDLALGKAALRYRVTDRGHDKVYEPVTAGTEIVETDAGSYEAVKVVRENTNDKKRTIFWCARELGYLPVKVAHREKNGNETIVTLKTLTRHP
jgi:hypothetical protein